MLQPVREGLFFNVTAHGDTLAVFVMKSLPVVQTHVIMALAPHLVVVTHVTVTVALLV